MENRKAFKPGSFSTPLSPLFSQYETQEQKLRRLENTIEQMRIELGQERQRRYDAEMEAQTLKTRIAELESNQKRKRRTKAEIEAEGKQEYCEFKSDGKRKAHCAEPIRSFDDFVAIQEYFLRKNKIRDWLMWTLGVAIGIRVSDLLSLKMRDLLNDDKTFRDRIVIIEQKTNKANNCLITEAVINSVTRYLDSINWQFEMDDYLFKSAKTKGKMYEEYGWKILSDAGKALNLPFVVGSHTMRKSFANIAACVDKSSIDMNAITKIQGLLNHSDQRVTMRYLGTYQKMFDNARKAVSDFVLGKTNINELVAGNNYTIDDIMSKLDSIEEKQRQEK